MADIRVTGKKVETTITGKKKYFLFLTSGGKTIKTPVSKGTFDNYRVNETY